jgi:F-type H+-transporting ATPase subunit b
MPQFDFTTYSSQIFWFSICFAALYLAMHCVVLPRITSIIINRKNVIEGDLLLAEELDKKMTSIRVKTDSLRQEAGQKYQSQLEEAAKKAAKQREKSIEELKEKFDEITHKSRQELKNFIEKSQVKNEAAAQNLVQIIKEKIFS